VIEPRVMQVLIALARADGAMVTRDELNAWCWHGRIVGEDALNRVISRLRAITTDIGAGIFQVETLNRVGYRLIPGLPETAAAPLPVAPPADTAAVSPPRSISAWWRSRHWLLVASIALLALAGAGLWWMIARPGAATVAAVPQLFVPTFTRLSPDVSPALASAAREEIVSAFGETAIVGVVTDDAHLGAGALSWRLSGTIARAGPNIRFVVHLTHESTGKIVWSQAIERPASDPAAALKSVAATIEEVIAWSLLDAASYHDGTLPDDSLALLLQWNQNRALQAGVYYHAQVEMRRLVEQSPDFGPGWSTLALALGYTATESGDPAAARAARHEAPAVIATALKLRPNDASALLSLAKSLQPSDFAGRDAAFITATAAPTSHDGAEHSAYSVFLLNVGRITEAVRQAKFTYDLDPLGRTYMSRYARTLAQNGQNALAASVMDRTLLLWPGDTRTLDVQARAELASGDHARGVAAVRADTRLSSPVRDAMLATFDTLQSGDRAAKDRLAANLVRLGADPATQSSFIVSALGALGHDDDAIAAADRLITAKNAMAAEVLFDPTLASARRTPAFAALVTRIGLRDYWRKSHHAPDFCLKPDAPSFCAEFRPAT
jgi:TolB-like protein